MYKRKKYTNIKYTNEQKTNTKYSLPRARPIILDQFYIWQKCKTYRKNCKCCIVSQNCQKWYKLSTISKVVTKFKQTKIIHKIGKKKTLLVKSNDFLQMFCCSPNYVKSGTHKN